MFSRTAVYFVLSFCFLPLASACRSIRPDAQTRNEVPSKSSIEMATDITKIKYKAGSWAIPDVAPCALIDKADAEAVMGLLRDEPKPGGTAIDGTACAYISREPFVVTVGIISTNSFEVGKFDAGNRMINNLGDEAYITAPNAFEDVNLLARRENVAVLINVSTGAWDEKKVERYRIAKTFAQTALARLLGNASENRDK